MGCEVSNDPCKGEKAKHADATEQKQLVEPMIPAFREAVKAAERGEAVIARPTNQGGRAQTDVVDSLIDSLARSVGAAAEGQPIRLTKEK